MICSKSPPRECVGMRVFAKTQGTPLPSKTTRRDQKRCSGATGPKRDLNRNSGKTSHDSSTTSTANLPSLKVLSLAVSDPESNSQSRAFAGIAVTASPATGHSAFSVIDRLPRTNHSTSEDDFEPGMSACEGLR